MTLYVVLLLTASVFVSVIIVKDKKNLAFLKQNLAKKIKSEVLLTASDVIVLGRSYKLTPNQSRRVLYEIYRDIDDPIPFEKLKMLVEEVKKDEPIDELPEEVKPTMVSISKLIDSQEGYESHFLAPLFGTLSKYSDLISEREKLKRRSLFISFLGIVSFLLGAVSFYITINTPDATDIARELNTILETEVTNK